MSKSACIWVNTGIIFILGLMHDDTDAFIADRAYVHMLASIPGIVGLSFKKPSRVRISLSERQRMISVSMENYSTLA